MRGKMTSGTLCLSPLSSYYSFGVVLLPFAALIRRDWSPLVRSTPTAGGEVADDLWTERKGLRFTATGWFPEGAAETPFDDEGNSTGTTPRL